MVGIAGLVVVLIVLAFVVVSTFFHRATVSISLNEFVVPITETFTASPDGVLLSFTERTVEETVTQSVPQSGSEFVEDHAFGTITIYNEHSTASQRLITNTRFESPEGFIYRIKNPVVVPGYTLTNGTKVPGKIEITAYADEAGETYNIAAADFTIPGLKGSPQYDAMYARSTEAFSGGFIGERAIVEKSIRDTTVLELKNTATAKVREKLLASVTESEVLFPETITINFIEQPEKVGSDGALVSVVAQATGQVFAEDKLARAIAQEGNVTYSAPLTIANFESLAILTEASKTDDTITLTISGDARLVGAYDEKRLIQDLSGKDRRSVGTVLSGYPAIKDMRISVYPFWRGQLPEKVERITIAVEAESE